LWLLLWPGRNAFVTTIAIWNSAIIAFAVAAAVGDIRWRRIPRWFTLSGLLAGLLFHWHYGGVMDALAAAFLAFVMGLIFFSMGAIGGGDVKLITALGAMMGLHPWMLAMQIAVVAATLMALIQVARRRAFRQTLRNLREILRNLLTQGIRAHPYIHTGDPAVLQSPFGLAAAVGVVTAVIRLYQFKP
jgi:prepilin peptidase CpaA